MENQYLRSNPIPNRGSFPYWEQFELAWPPSKLYRVHYEAAGTEYSDDNGFVSPSKHHPQQLSDDDFWRAGRLHFNWNTDNTLWDDNWRILISTFSNKVHAVNWARRYETSHPGQKVKITTMDTSPLKKVDTPVFNAQSMINEMELPLKRGLRPKNFADEFLVLHHIPADSIVRQETLPTDNESGDPLWGLRKDTPDPDENEFYAMVPPGHPMYMKPIPRSELPSVRGGS